MLTIIANSSNIVHDSKETCIAITQRCAKQFLLAVSILVVLVSGSKQVIGQATPSWRIVTVHYHVDLRVRS